MPWLRIYAPYQSQLDVGHRLLLQSLNSYGWTGWVYLRLYPEIHDLAAMPVYCHGDLAVAECCSSKTC